MRYQPPSARLPPPNRTLHRVFRPNSAIPSFQRSCFPVLHAPTFRPLTTNGPFSQMDDSPMAHRLEFSPLSCPTSHSAQSLSWLTSTVLYVFSSLRAAIQTAPHS